MLINIGEVNNSRGRNLRRERRLCHEPANPMEPLGCRQCPEYQICGGIRINEGVVDCLAFCCSDPGNCDRVCRNNPNFADRIREISTFQFDTVPIAEAADDVDLPRVIPLLFHRGSRGGRFAVRIAAVPLYGLLSRRDGRPRFCTREALRNTYWLAPRTQLLVSGTDRDTPLEHWWSLGEGQRRAIIRTLRRVGVVFATTPNYSLFTDVPRWDNLHSMKRIAIVHQEFLSEGLPAALHVNARTENDFWRWTEHIDKHSEIRDVAYEFTTGTASASRRRQHAEWLCSLAKSIDRPLRLLVRGGVEVLPQLRQAFARLSFIETDSFIKSVNRQRASTDGGRSLHWASNPTEIGETLDELFSHNYGAVRRSIIARIEMPPVGSASGDD